MVLLGLQVFDFRCIEGGSNYAIGRNQVKYMLGKKLGSLWQEYIPPGELSGIQLSHSMKM